MSLGIAVRVILAREPLQMVEYQGSIAENVDCFCTVSQGRHRSDWSYCFCVIVREQVHTYHRGLRYKVSRSRRLAWHIHGTGRRGTVQGVFSCWRPEADCHRPWNTVHVRRDKRSFQIAVYRACYEQSLSSSMQGREINSTLKSILKKLCTEKPADWDRFLEPALFAYRVVRREILGFSPFQMLYDRTVRGTDNLSILCLFLIYGTNWRRPVR